MVLDSPVFVASCAGFFLPLFHLFFCPLVLDLFHSYQSYLPIGLKFSLRLVTRIILHKTLFRYKVARSPIVLCRPLLVFIKDGVFFLPHRFLTLLTCRLRSQVRCDEVFPPPSHFSQYVVASAYSSNCYMLILVPAATYPVFGPHDTLPMGRCEWVRGSHLVL